MTTKTKTKVQPLSSSLVHRKIDVQGCIISIYAATAEQFDIYIYDILDILYNDEKKMIKVRDTTFNKDWRDVHNRVNAIYDLHSINIKRRGGPIALFADEE